MNDNKRKGDVVAVWRDHILEFPETFIAGQALDLKRWHSILVGLERRNSPIDLPEDRVITCGSGPLAVILRESVRRMRWLPPWWLARIASHAPRILHAHYAVDACHALPLATKLNIPLMVTSHGYDVAQEDETSGQRTPTWHRYLRRREELLATASKFIAVSRYTAGRMELKGFPSERTTVIPIGIDLEYFDGIRDDKTSIHILFVGRISPEKGIPDLLNAVRSLSSTMPNLTVDIVGDGPDLGAAKKEANSIPAHFTFHGAVSRNHVRNLLRKTEVLCLPSRTNKTGSQETFGLVLAEAQAMKVPVVSYRIGGIPEAVSDEKTGLLCTEGDSEGLARAIGTLLSDKALRERMGIAGRLFIEQNYDRRRCIEQLELVYDAVAASK